MTTPHSTHEEEFAAARQNVAADKQNFRPVATVRQYNSKQKAFIAFCETKAYRDGSTVTENKLLVWLEEIWRKGNKRQQIKKTHRGKQRKRQVQGIGSNGTNAEESPDSPGTLANGAVNSGVDSSESSTGNTINLVGVWKPYSKEGLEGYCRPIVDLWRKQQNLGMNTHPTPRGSDVQAFLKNKEQETLRHSRSEFADRGIHTLLDGYQDKMPDICDWYFNQKTGNHLRNRLDFLCGHALITRGESNRKLQLPDLFPLQLQNEGPAETCTAVIAVLRQGKMNQNGRIEYAGMLRNKDVLLCPISALAIYFFWRWDIEGEDFPKLAEKKNWYNTYVEKGDGGPTKEISYTAQAAGIEGAFSACGVLSTKLTHAMRSGGIQMAEQNHASELDLRRGGRWNREKMEGCYLSALPRQLMRAVAGWSSQGGTYFLPRDVRVPSMLQEKIFPWLDDQKKAHRNGDNDIAATYFIKLLEYLRCVLLQDCAILKEKYDDHPLFQHSVFQCDEFEVYAEQVRRANQTADTPAHLLLQRAMPHLADQINTGFKASLARDDMLNEAISRVVGSVEGLASTTAQIQRMLGNAQISISFGNAEGSSNTFRHSSSSMIAVPSCSPIIALPSRENENSTVPQTLPEVADPLWKLYRHHQKVESVWQEYEQGLCGLPPVEKLDSKYSAAWRKTPAERKYYSGKKVIYDMIKSTAITQKISHGEAVNKWEAKRQELKFSIDALQKWIKNGGSLLD